MFTLQTKLSILKALVTKKSPYYIQFYINGRCNLMCRQCNIVETNSRIKEMSLDEIASVAKHLRQIGSGIVLLTGGEPFMRDDLPQIVEIFTREKLNVRLQTAGTKYATEEKLLACYDAGARDINVSLDSLELDKFDYINAVVGSAKNAIETIERISKVFRKKSAILSFGTVMSQFNFRELPGIIEFAKRIGWFVSLVPVHISSPTERKGFRSYENDFVFSPDQFAELDKLGERLIEMKKKRYPIFDSERFILSSISFLKGNGPTWRKNGVCDSPNLYFAIRPNGAFTTCCDYTLTEPPMVQDESFVRDYKSGKVQGRKDVLKIVKNCSGCHYGSYPEVTISVRDPKAFVERTFLVFKSGQGKLSDAPVQSDFLGEVKRIRESMPAIYPTEQWMKPELTETISLWTTAEGRRELVARDKVRRREQFRERGKGDDVPIAAEGEQILPFPKPGAASEDSDADSDSREGVANL